MKDKEMIEVEAIPEQDEPIEVEEIKLPSFYLDECVCSATVLIAESDADSL